MFKIKEDLCLILVAENLKGDTAQICGFVIGKVVEDEGEVLKIGVDLPFQGRGIGRKLLENLLLKFRQRGVKKVYLEVRKSNKRAINLYKSLHFRKIGERKKYYGKEDALVFVYEFLYKKILEKISHKKIKKEDKI